MTDKHKRPRTTEKASQLCERFALLDSQINALEQRRNAAISKVNALIDKKSLPMIAERNQIAEMIKPWWMKAREKLLSGSAKSLELGGCIIGTRKDRDTVDCSRVAGKPVDALANLRWAKPYINKVTNYSLNAKKLIDGIDGKHGEKLNELGFAKKKGEEQFFIKPSDQGRTVAAAS